MTSRKSCTLAQALNYCNEDIIYRFTTLYDVSMAEAEGIFTETKKWLWLNMQPDMPPLFISDAMKIIDEMWHNFILFTYEYSCYCQGLYGAYIHHAPVTRSAKDRMASELTRDPELAIEERAGALRAQCAFIHDKLGEDTLLTWYVTYPERYGAEFFRHKQIVRPPSWRPGATLRDLANSHSRTGQETDKKAA